MLRHVVMFGFKPEVSAQQIKEVEDAFCALPSQIDLIKGYEWGTDCSPEGLQQGLTHCFFLTFHSDADRDAYLVHPAHKAFGKVLGDKASAVTVVDYWTKNTYQVTRTGGNYHADAAFVSAEDEQAFSACFGGSATWEKRPIVLEVGGRRFAGSTFGSLNAAGEVSIYFLDSGSDIGGIEDAEHNSNIYIAAGNNA